MNLTSYFFSNIPLPARDSLVAVGWVGLLLGVSLQAAKLIRLIQPAIPRSLLIPCIIIVIWATTVIATFSLSLAHLLTAPALFLTMTFVFLAGWRLNSVLSRRYQPDTPDPTFRTQPSSFETGLTLASWLWIASLLGTRVVGHGIWQFPSNWDSLMYHVPLINHWLQNASVNSLACAVWYVPGNAEVLGLWIVAPFSGDFWIGLFNVPSLVLIAFAVFEIARQLQLSPVLAHLLAMSSLAIRVAFMQSSTAENDLAVSALFLSLTAYGFLYARTLQPFHLALSAACFGLLAGIKYYALGFAAVGGLGIVFLALRVHGSRKAIQVSAAYAVAFLFLASYWYVRNYGMTGTPLYPLGYHGPADVLAGPRSGLWFTSLLGNRRIGLVYLWLRAVWDLAGPIQAMAVLMIPVSLFWLLCIVDSRTIPALPPVDLQLRRVLGLMLLGSLGVFLITPFTVDPNSNGQSLNVYSSVRFSQSTFLLATVALGVTLSDLVQFLVEQPTVGLKTRHLFRSFVPGMILALCAFQYYLRSKEQLAETAFMIPTLGILLVSFAGLAFLLSFYRLLGIPLVVLTMAIASTALADRWHTGFSQHYDRTFRTTVFSQLERQRIRDPIAILDYRYYPFFGSRRQFTVSRPRQFGSMESFLRYLDTDHVKTVAIIRRDTFRNGRYRNVTGWPKLHTSIFSLIESSAEFDVYSINQTQLSRLITGDLSFDDTSPQTFKN